MSADQGAPRPTPTTALLKDEESDDAFESLRELKEKRTRRECPIPKPSGRVGEMLGFKPTKGEIEEQRRSSRPP